MFTRLKFVLVLHSIMTQQHLGSDSCEYSDYGAAVPLEAFIPF